MTASSADRVGRGEERPELAIFLQDLGGGGAERMMVNLAAGLADRGVRVDLVLSRKEGPYLRDVPSSVRVVDLGARRVMSVLLPFARYLREQRPQVVLSTLIHVNVAALLSRALARVSIPVIVREASHMSHSQRTVTQWPIKIAYRLAPMIYRRADRIVAVSEGVASDAARFLRMPRDRVEVAYNPVITRGMLESAQEAPDHPWMKEDIPVILNVGRLIGAKDQSTLLRAFAKLREDRQARLIILGEGPLRGDLERLAEALGITDDVSMPGFVANPFAYMSRAACFVLSSASEGLPGVLIQAMACGSPVVSTDCESGPAEILDGGRLGALVPVRDPAALARAMRTTLEQLPPGVGAAEGLQARFSTEAAVERYIQIMREVTPKDPGPHVV